MSAHKSVYDQNLVCSVCPNSENVVLMFAKTCAMSDTEQLPLDFSSPDGVHLLVILHGHAPPQPALFPVHLVHVHPEGVEILVDAAAVLAPPLR